MIKEGRVEVFRDGGDGQRVVLAIVDEGQSLGEFAMIDKQPRSASARAISTVVAVKVSESSYAELLGELPTWAQAMLEGLVSRLRSANDIIRQHEAIDEMTKTNFELTEFEHDTNTAIDIEIDFAELSNPQTKKAG